MLFPYNTYGSIQQRELIDRHIFRSYYDAKKQIKNYMLWYNCRIIHGTLNGLTLLKKWIHGIAGSRLIQ